MKFGTFTKLNEHMNTATLQVKKIFLLVTLLLLVVGQAYCATIYTVNGSGGQWNSDIWTTTSGGTVVLNLRPGAGDNVILTRSFSMTNYTTPALGSVTINSSKTLSIGVNGVLNYTSMTLTGQITLSSNGSISGGSISLSGILTANNTSTITAGNISNSGSITLNNTSAMTLATLTNDNSFNNAGGVTVHITGDLINNSNFSDANGGTMSFEGSTQLITGAVDFFNISISDGTAVSLDVGASCSLTGALVLNGTTSTFDVSAGSFVVNSLDETLGGRIGELKTPSNLTGSMTIQRYVPGNSLGDYRYMSIPISSANLGDWQAAFGVTGDFTDPSTSAEFPNIVDAGKNNASVFTFDIASQQFVAVSAPGASVSSVSLSPTTAYAAYEFNSSGFTLSYTGSIQKGDIPITISSNASDYNLIPNPYPSPIDWDKVNLTGVGSVVSVRTANGVFAQYPQGGTAASAINPPFSGWTGEIAIGQSFWVQSSGGSTSLLLQESNKTLNQAQFVRSQTLQNYMRIALSSSNQRDETLIIFNPEATDGTDFRFDAPKFRNGVYTSVKTLPHINLSTYVTEKAKQYGINTIAPFTNASKTVGLKIADVPTGSYSLTFTELSSFTLGYSIKLVDHFTNKNTAVTDNLVYNFDVTADKNSFGDSRFELQFDNLTTGTSNSVEATNCVIYPNPSSGIVTLSLPQVMDESLTGVYLYDTRGSIVTSSESNASWLKMGDKSLDISNIPNGIYILNIISGSQAKSIRLVKK